MFSFEYHLAFCNRHDPKKFRPFYINEEVYGAVTPALVELLPLKLAEDFVAIADGLTFSKEQNDYIKRSAALARASAMLCERYKVKLRHEKYSVVQKWGEQPVAEIDRASVPWFGFPGFGVHVNGYVRKPDGLYLWIGERALDRQVDPGKLDNLIGGGMPLGLTVEQNLLKEAKEEAGFSPDIMRGAKQTSILHYKIEKMLGLRNDFLFIYDLELPENVVPHNTDGEVAAFHLMPLDEVADIVRTTDRFKFNCNVVIIDFMLRHGALKPDNLEYAVSNMWIQKMRA